MPHAFILGGTGQIGRATAALLLDQGWSVALAHRGLHKAPGALLERGASLVAVDRDRSGDLMRAIGSGADLLVDAVAYEPEHARQLLDVQSDLGALAVISSSSVYSDEAGRTLDEAAETGFPLLPDPVREDHLTVEPGPATYSTRKLALERKLVEEARLPLTVLRPAAIHGPGSSHPREWWVLKRVLDGRPFLPIAYRGLSRFHTTAASNIAEALRVCVGLTGVRILNVADPQALTVADIVGLVADHLGYRGRILPMEDEEGYPPTMGRTPWSVQHPFVLDTRALQALGYTPRSDYAAGVASTCEGLRDAAATEDWRAKFPVLAAYPFDLFDYDREDAWLASLSMLPTSPHPHRS